MFTLHLFTIVCFRRSERNACTSVNNIIYKYIVIVNKAFKPTQKKELLMSGEVCNKALKMIEYYFIWNGLSCCLLIRCPWEIGVAFKSNNRSFHRFSMALLFRPSLPNRSRQPLAHLWTVLFFSFFVFIILNHLESLLFVSRYFNYMATLPQCHLLNHRFVLYYWSTVNK